MKTCPKCGNVTQNDNARNCSACGADLYVRNDGGIWLGEGPAPVVPESPRPSAPKRKSHVGKIALFALLGLALVAVIAIVVNRTGDSDEGSGVADAGGLDNGSELIDDGGIVSVDPSDDINVVDSEPNSPATVEVQTPSVREPVRITNQTSE